MRPLTDWNEHFGPCVASPQGGCRGLLHNEKESSSITGSNAPKGILESRPGRDPDPVYNAMLCPEGQNLWLTREAFLYVSQADPDQAREIAHSDYEPADIAKSYLEALAKRPTWTYRDPAATEDDDENENPGGPITTDVSELG